MTNELRSKKQKRYTFRMPSSEYALLKQKSAHSNLPLSRYVRLKLLSSGGKLKISDTSDNERISRVNKAINRLERKYKGVGENLNQVVKLSHILSWSNQAMPDELERNIKLTRKSLRRLDNDVQSMKEGF